jgi:hypothetical protein
LFIDMQCRFFSLFSSREAIFLNISSFVILKDVGWNARHLLQVMFVIDVKYLAISFNIAQQMVMLDMM